MSSTMDSKTLEILDELFIGWKLSTEKTKPRQERLRLSENIPWDKDRLKRYSKEKRKVKFS